MSNQQTPERFTIQEIADYISGWASGPYETVHLIGKSTLLNALSQLEDDQDGIAAVRMRKLAAENQQQSDQAPETQ